MGKTLKQETKDLADKLLSQALSHLEDICEVQPNKVIIEKGQVFYQKPCGVICQKFDEVHCDLYKDKSCEYYDSPKLTILEFYRGNGINQQKEP